MAAYGVPRNERPKVTGPFSRVLGPLATVPATGGSASANPVTATVTVAAANPTVTVLSNASAVAALVTVAGNNAAPTTAKNATSVTATVTVAATNPTFTVSSAATSITATVTVTATNPTTAIGALAFPVTATVTVSATNPTTKLSANPPSVTATVTVAATNPTNKLSANPPSVYAAVTVAAANASSLLPFPHPASISGRKVLDQDGGVFLLFTMSSWGMAQQLSNADITTALEGIAADGFNAVTVDMTGSIDHGTGWTRYQNTATGQNFWTGTPFQSSLGAAWASVDWIVSEAARLGMCVCMSLFGGYGGPTGTEGGGADWVAATDTQMRTVGVAVATRYLAATNIIWHLELDYSEPPSATRGVRAEAFFDGVNTTEGGTSLRPMRWMEPDNGTTAYDQGWDLTTNLHPVNTGYSYSTSGAVTVEGWYTDAAVPVGDCEPVYDGHTLVGQELRYRSYAVFVEGGCLINYGHEDWWCFGGAGIFTEGLTWQDVPAHSHTVQQSYCWSLMAAFVADTTWAPSAFVTGGEGTTSSKAAAGNSDTAAIAYFPNSRGSITVNTTLLTGTGNVRLRWYDPTTGGYTSISASEAQNASRAVTHPGNNAAGDGDQVLVVDLLSVAVDATSVTATVTVAATNPTVTVSSAATSITATVTVTATNPVGHGTANPSAVFAAVTVAASNPTVTVLSNASAVTPTVTVTATNPAAHGDANASSVTALVTVAANNAVGQTSAAGSANSVAATVTVDATNPTVKVSSASSPVTATVTVSATNPTVTRLSNASPVAATVTVAGFNPTTKLTANPPSVFAAVTVTGNNAVGQVNAAGTANAVAALVVIAATNPTVTRLSNAGALTGGVTAAAANATTKLTAAIVAVYAAVQAEAFNASSVRLGLRASTTSVRIDSATVAATLTSSSGTDSITSATATEDIP